MGKKEQHKTSQKCYNKHEEKKTDKQIYSITIFSRSKRFRVSCYIQTHSNGVDILWAGLASYMYGAKYSRGLYEIIYHQSWR